MLKGSLTMRNEVEDLIIKTTASEKVAAKFNCLQVAAMADGKRVVKLAPVTDTGVIENNALWVGAAKGKVEITVTSAEHADFFVPGASYYFQMVRVPELSDDAEQESEAEERELVGKGKKR